MASDEVVNSWTEERLRFCLLLGRVTGWKPLPTLQQRLLSPDNILILMISAALSVKGIVALIDQWDEFEEVERSGVLAMSTWQFAFSYLFVRFSLISSNFNTLPEVVRTLLSTPCQEAETGWVSPTPIQGSPRRRGSVSVEIPLELRNNVVLASRSIIAFFGILPCLAQWIFYTAYALNVRSHIVRANMALPFSSEDSDIAVVIGISLQTMVVCPRFFYHVVSCIQLQALVALRCHYASKQCLECKAIEDMSECLHELLRVTGPACNIISSVFTQMVIICFVCLPACLYCAIAAAKADDIVTAASFLVLFTLYPVVFMLLSCIFPAMVQDCKGEFERSILLSHAVLRKDTSFDSLQLLVLQLDRLYPRIEFLRMSLVDRSFFIYICEGVIYLVLLIYAVKNS